MYKVNVPTFNLDKLENVKSAVEHVGLYVGLVIFTAAGAKVNGYQINNRYYVDLLALKHFGKN